MLRVLFIDPPISSKATTADVREFVLHKRYSCGILSIMAYVKEKLPDCQLRYLRITAYDEEKFKKELEDFLPDIVGFSCNSYDFYSTYHFIALAKAILPCAHICCGGPHATFFPKETLSLPEVDSVVAGEGEQPFLNLCNYLKNDALLESSGIYLKHDLKIKKEFVPYFNQSLDELPIPDVRLLDDYLSYTSFLTGEPAAVLLTSRGCPYVCNYCCSKPSHYRAVSITRVVEIISQYVSCGIQEFEFWDETFNPNIKRLQDFAEEIKKKRLEISFAIRGAVVSNISYDSLKSLKDAGLRRIQFGVETCSQRLLELMNKKITREQVHKAFEVCNSLGIHSVANLMIGIPTQTEEEIFNDMEFVWLLRPTYISISVFNYAPNTEFYNELLKKGSVDFWRQFACDPAMRMQLRHCEDHLSRQRLFELQATFTKRYYYRFPYLSRYFFIAKHDEMLRVLRMGVRTLFSRSMESINK